MEKLNLFLKNMNFQISIEIFEFYRKTNRFLFKMGYSFFLNFLIKTDKINQVKNRIDCEKMQVVAKYER